MELLELKESIVEELSISGNTIGPLRVEDALEVTADATDDELLLFDEIAIVELLF